MVDFKKLGVSGLLLTSILLSSCSLSTNNVPLTQQRIKKQVGPSVTSNDVEKREYASGMSDKNIADITRFGTVLSNEIYKKNQDVIENKYKDAVDQHKKDVKKTEGFMDTLNRFISNGEYHMSRNVYNFDSNPNNNIDEINREFPYLASAINYFMVGPENMRQEVPIKDLSKDSPKKSPEIDGGLEENLKKESIENIQKNPKSQLDMQTLTQKGYNSLSSVEKDKIDNLKGDVEISIDYFKEAGKFFPLGLKIDNGENSYNYGIGKVKGPQGNIYGLAEVDKLDAGMLEDIHNGVNREQNWQLVEGVAYVVGKVILGKYVYDKLTSDGGTKEVVSQEQKDAANKLENLLNQGSSGNVLF